MSCYYWNIVWKNRMGEKIEMKESVASRTFRDDKWSLVMRVLVIVWGNRDSMGKKIVWYDGNKLLKRFYSKRVT